MTQSACGQWFMGQSDLFVHEANCPTCRETNLKQKIEDLRESLNGSELDRLRAELADETTRRQGLERRVEELLPQLTAETDRLIAAQNEIASLKVALAAEREARQTAERAYENKVAAALAHLHHASDWDTLEQCTADLEALLNNFPDEWGKCERCDDAERQRDEMAAALEKAFVDGATWCEWKPTNTTTWQSDQNDAAEEAFRLKPRYADASAILAARDKAIERRVHASFIRAAGLTCDDADERLGPHAAIEDAEAWLKAHDKAQWGRARRGRESTSPQR